MKSQSIAYALRQMSLLCAFLAGMTGSLSMTIGSALAAAPTTVIDEATKRANSTPSLKVVGSPSVKADIKARFSSFGDTQEESSRRHPGISPLVAGADQTALSGVVMSTTGDALPNAIVTDGSMTTSTDNQGRYLLVGLAPGTSVLTIDAHHAGPRGNIDYGYYEVQVTAAQGQTTILPYTNWLPKIDHKHEVTFSSPTRHEIVIKNPALPGLELHIPKGTVITGVDHKIVRKVGITPIPLDRTPFPLPNNVSVPIYFTVQPGGAVLTGVGGKWVGASVWYPDFDKQLPKARASFFKYDAYNFGWTVYGVGIVDAKMKHYVPDANTRIYNLSSAMIDAGFTPPGTPPEPPPQHCVIEWLCICLGGGSPASAGPAGSPGGAPIGGAGDPPDGPPSTPPKGTPPKPPGCGSGGGDPVALATGLWTDATVDLSLGDVIPIALSRTYLSGDTNVRSFGVGMTNNYETYLWSANQYQEADLIMPNGSRVHYVRTSSGTSYADAVFTASTNPGPYFNSTIAWNANIKGWTLTRQDGMIYVFPEYSPISYMQDRYGNRITFGRSGGVNQPITSISSSNGRSIIFTYTNGVITKAADNFSRSVTYTYDSSNRLQTVTNPDGGITTYTWDTTNNRITSVQRPRQNPSGPKQVTNSYDSNGRVHTQTMADGSVWTFNYTLSGSTVTETDVTDPNSNVSKTTFSSAGYWLTQKLGYGSSVEQDYTAVLGGSTPPAGCAGNTPANSPTNYLIGETDALGRLTCFTYDSAGSILTSTRLAGTAGAATATYTYDAYEQIATITDPLNHTLTISRDVLGRMTAVTDALSHVWPVSTNNDGTIASVADPLGNTTNFTYDHTDLTSVTDPLSRITTRYYDSIGRPVQTTNPLGNLWVSSHDPIWGVLQQVDPNGNVAATSFTADGRLSSFTDPRSTTGTPIKTQFSYDALDRLTGRTDPLSNSASITSYDGVGNVLTSTDRKSQSTTYTYDALNRIATATFADGHTLSYTWDAGNRLTQLQDTAGGVSNTVNRTYDNLDRLTQEATLQGATTIGTINYTYDAADRPATMSVSGQSSITYTWDDANRLTQTVQGTASVGITYDNANRRGTLTYPNGVIKTYSFDYASELTALSYDEGATNVGTLGYSYDAGSHVSSRNGSLFSSVLPAAISSASYNANNQLTAWGSVSPSYDLNGNMTSDGTNTYAWDARNRLTSVGSSSYIYDGFDRRQAVTVGSNTTATVYDGFSPVQELSGTNQTDILTGPQSDERYTRTNASTTSTYVSDLLGSSVGLTDNTGTIQTNYSYDPYGATSTSGASNDNPYQFTGRSNDTSGLYYYRARYYNPTWGRFVSEDPAGLSVSPNLYSYVGGNPTGRTDPAGLWQFTVTLGWGPAGQLTFGHNGGQWNAGYYHGAGVGASWSFDPNDTGCHRPGFDPGVSGEADFKFGDADIGVTSGVSLRGGTPVSVSVPDPAIPNATVNILDPESGPTFGGGAVIFVGTGGTIYF